MQIVTEKITSTPVVNMWYHLFIYSVIYFLAALGLPCCMQASSSCGECELLFAVFPRLLTVVTSLAVEHGFCGACNSIVSVQGFSAAQHLESSWTRD